MKNWIDEQTGCKMCEPDCVDEWLSDIYNIGYDYDGYRDAKNLMELIDELLEMFARQETVYGMGNCLVYMVVQRRKRNERITLE